jgi:amidase
MSASLDLKALPFGSATAPAFTSLLPSTGAPVGLTPEGLPVGLQIVGPEMGDRSTRWLAGRLAQLIGACAPPQRL